MPHVDQWRATCYHEAAHAVFALKVCDGMVRYVSAEESYCDAKLSAFGGWAEHWRQAIYTLGGSFAEQLEIWDEIRPEPWEDVLEAVEVTSEEIEERGDRLCLIERLADMGEDMEENYYIVVEDTEDQVRSMWPQIVAVAERLSEAGRLKGEEVAALIGWVHSQGEE